MRQPARFRLRLAWSFGLGSLLVACHPQTPSQKPTAARPARAPAAPVETAAAKAAPTGPTTSAAPESATPPPKGERILPLGAARPTSIVGEVAVVDASGRKRLRLEDRVASGQRLETATGAHLELGFADGSLLRLGGGTIVTLLADTRQAALHRGRILVAADRMLGSIGVLTRYAALVPEGTTYLVEVAPEQPLPFRLTVLEGAVWVSPVVVPTSSPASSPSSPPTAAAGRPAPGQAEIVLSGERCERDARPGPGHRSPVPLLALLADEPLIKHGPLPRATRLRIDEPADQQRRGFLPGRNERLRREIFWKRPGHVRPEVPLPEVFIRYEYPLSGSPL